MELSNVLIALGGVVGVLLTLIVIWVMTLRRIVDPNFVHIVQRTKSTTSYGSKQPQGNVYYAFPSWLPAIGITVRILPVNNFDLDLTAYPAYDKDRVPFLVDIKSFFRIADTNAAAQRVENFNELKKQISAIVQDAVRSILAKSDLEKIMQERTIYAEQFTEAVGKDVQHWGVEVVKPIALMDVRDGNDTQVIANIMAKKKSFIEMESRTEVAINKRKAEEAEIEAKKEVEVKKAEADRQSGEAKAISTQKIGVATAESDKKIGIAKQQAEQDIEEQKKVTEEKKMKVLEVNTVRQAEIAKEALIVKSNAEKEALIIDTEARQKEMQISADAKKYEIEQIALATLTDKEKAAKAIELTGIAEAVAVKEKGSAAATAEKEMQLARVTAEVTLAEKIGENDGYQDYLVRIETVKIQGDVDKTVGTAQARALEVGLAKAELKVIANSGNVGSGITGLKDMLTTSAGGQGLAAALEGVKQTETGSDLVSGLIEKFAPAVIAGAAGSKLAKK